MRVWIARVGTLNSAKKGLLHLEKSAFIWAIAVYSCSMLFYEVLSIENNPWAGLARILALLAQPQNMGVLSTFACFRGRAFLGIRCSWRNWINQFRLKQGCCPLLSGVDSDCCFFCASFGRSLCHGDEHHGIDPNMSSSGHHDGPQRLSFSAQRANCNLPTPGFATRTIPKGAPLPIEHFKN